MKISPMATFKLGLFILALGLGALMTKLSYEVGREALKSVSQPDVNPTKKFIVRSGSEGEATVAEEPFVDERTLLVQVYDRIQAANPKAADTSNNLESESPPPQTESASSEAAPDDEPDSALKFPLSATASRVTLAVDGAAFEENKLVLSVTLTNDSRDAVKFLYSLLEIKDEDERILVTTTRNLPDEIPANGQVFAGQIDISRALVATSERLTLALESYPDSEVVLTIDEIPVNP
ncbi:MAG: hypothetical protein AAGG02_06975 [Cyanobacteria bacterium P01_H01_bin.15]